MVKALPAEDAYVLVYQVSKLPAHECWMGGKSHYISAGPKAVLNILDVNAAPVCRITEPFENIHFHIPRAALDDVADESDVPRITELRAPRGWSTSDPVVGKLLTCVAPVMRRPEQTSRLFVDHTLFALQVHLARTYGGMREIELRRIGGLASWQERRARELIDANLLKEASLQQIARECGLSVSYFSRAFKVSTGLTPHDWLQRRRVSRAKELLLAGNAPLAEIALTCGFADQSHLTRVFARLAGNTPHAWRRFRQIGLGESSLRTRVEMG